MTNRLIVFREMISVYGDSHMKHTSTLYGRNRILLILQRMVHIDISVFLVVNKI